MTDGVVSLDEWRARHGAVWVLPEPSPKGVWVLYHHDYGPVADVVFESLEDAVRTQARQGYGVVGFWPFGTSLADAVKAWESNDG